MIFFIFPEFCTFFIELNWKLTRCSYIIHVEYWPRPLFALPCKSSIENSVSLSNFLLIIQLFLVDALLLLDFFLIFIYNDNTFLQICLDFYWFILKQLRFLFKIILPFAWWLGGEIPQSYKNWPNFKLLLKWVFLNKCWLCIW